MNGDQAGRLTVTAPAPLAVLKFGGTCVATESGRARVVREIVAKRAAGWRVVTVVSAMGRNGAPYATDTLLNLVQGQGGRANGPDYAAAYVCGELLSAAVLSTLLQECGAPAVCVPGWQAGIVADGDPADAAITAVRPQRLHDLLSEGRLPVVAGSQGATPRGDLATLGRGGSDTSATAFGVALATDLVEIVTDAPGLMTADPAVIATAELIPVISHQACWRMASLGAGVIHARAVTVAARRPEMPVLLRSLSAAGQGTRIGCSGWLAPRHGLPIGVASLPQPTVQAAGDDAGGRDVARLVRVSVVYEGLAPFADAARYHGALGDQGLVATHWAHEDDCFSAWVPAGDARRAVQALHAAHLTFGSREGASAAAQNLGPEAATTLQRR